MKRQIPILSLAGVATVVSGAGAQPAAEPTSNSKVILKGKLAPAGEFKAGVGSLNKSEPIGARYRLYMSFAPGNINDETPNGADHTFDVYGTLTINGETWWEMPRRTSDRGAQQMGDFFVPNNEANKAQFYGYSLTKPSAFNGNRDFEFDSYKDDPRSILKLALKLYDADTVPTVTDRSKDDTFGNYDLSLDLFKMGAGDYLWFWKDGNGNDSNFYLHVEKIKFLYEKPGSGLPRVVTKPAIIKPDIVIKGPGPVIKTRPLKRQE